MSPKTPKCFFCHVCNACVFPNLKKPIKHHRRIILMSGLCLGFKKHKNTKRWFNIWL